MADCFLMAAVGRPHLTRRLQGFGTSIFAEVTALAVRHGAVNLGQGFPDFDGPEFVREAAVRALREGRNQYSPTSGTSELRRAVAEHQRRFYGLDYDADAEVTVYAGATEAIHSTLQALLDPGDEVVLFEPFYDSYPACIALAGATARVVTLRAPRFEYDPDELLAAITPKTRAVLVNTPNNPSGKVFSRSELAHLAGICRERDLVAITDEVYEHMTYGAEHVPLASLPGMRERTVTISSTGKTFSMTGWKIGYSCAAPELTAALRGVHQFVTFCVATPLQHAMAAALSAPDDYFAALQRDYQSRRDRLCRGLAEAGFEVLTPAGTYFAQADIRTLGHSDDVEFCRMLPERVGVAAIPTSAFYANKAEGRHLVRFAFCKTDATLDEGIRRLGSLRA
jgi:N-succinyldiaminopimelate aminotransferase